jgi:type IV secretory pathway VirB2 component (pilin)
MSFDLVNPTSNESFEAFVQFILNYAIGTSVLIAVIALIVAGFKYIFAMGDDDKIKSATRSLMFALIGLVIVFIAPVLVDFVIDLVNQGS